MKKSVFLVTATILFTLVLAACSGGSTEDGTTTPGAFGDDQGLGTPSVTDDFGTIPTQSDDGLSTAPAVTAEATSPSGTRPASTPAATEAMGTPTMGATESVTSTVGGDASIRLDAGRLSYLLGFDVYTPDDEKVGEVEDIVLNLNAGNADYIIVGVGGFLGIGEKEVAIPCDLFEFPELDTSAGTVGSRDNEPNRLVLDIDMAALESAPDWDPELLPDLGQPATGWDTELNTYWSQYDTGLSSTGIGNATSTPGSDATPATSGQDLTVTGELQGVILASDAIGFNINTGIGDSIGEVEDIVIDTTNCQILYVVISYDAGDNGVSLVPVPPAAFMLDPDNRALFLADADTVLLDAPYFTEVDFPYTLTTGWDDNIRSFWETHIQPSTP